MRAQFTGRPRFRDPSQIHHHDPVADMFHHRQIMRNKQKSYFRFLLNILKQIHNLRLYTDIPAAVSIRAVRAVSLYAVGKSRGFVPWTAAPDIAVPVIFRLFEFLFIKNGQREIFPHCPRWEKGRFKDYFQPPGY